MILSWLNYDWIWLFHYCFIIELRLNLDCINFSSLLLSSLIFITILFRFSWPWVIHIALYSSITWHCFHSACSFIHSTHFLHISSLPPHPILLLQRSEEHKQRALNSSFSTHYASPGYTCLLYLFTLRQLQSRQDRLYQQSGSLYRLTWTTEHCHLWSKWHIPKKIFIDTFNSVVYNQFAFYTWAI